jgi:pimeloyl-ACP methyl ester carboxylesterase/catechol 2,3-dioxygenase-like lactoylglutathione lyase family enzyme
MSVLQRRVHVTTQSLVAIALALSAAVAQAQGTSPPATVPPPASDVVRRTTLIVHDLDASLRFYREVLGFELWLENRGKVTANSLPVDEPLGADSRFAVMRGTHPWVGMVGLLQYGAAKPLPDPARAVRPGNVVLMIETSQLHAIYARMNARGVRVLRPPETNEVTGAGGARWRATFLFAYDPDGHLLEINQREPLSQTLATKDSGAVARASRVERGFFAGRFGQLHFRRASPAAAVGAKPPLVLLHQTPLSGRMFTEILPALARDRVVYAIDTPGYGESDSPPQPPTIADYGDALQQFVADLREPVDLVGYHTGALIAADIAARYPASIRQLMLISAPLLSAEQLAKLDASTPLAADGSHVMAGWKSTMDTRPPEQSLELAARIVAEKQRAGSRAGWAIGAIQRHDAAATYRSVTRPTIVIRVRDTLFAQSAEVAALIPGAKVIETPPAWRYGIFDAQPAALGAMMLRALDGVPEP